MYDEIHFLHTSYMLFRAVDQRCLIKKTLYHEIRTRFELLKLPLQMRYSYILCFKSSKHKFVMRNILFSKQSLLII